MTDGRNQQRTWPVLPWGFLTWRQGNRRGDLRRHSWPPCVVTWLSKWLQEPQQKPRWTSPCVLTSRWLARWSQNRVREMAWPNYHHAPLGLAWCLCTLTGMGCARMDTGQLGGSTAVSLCLDQPRQLNGQQCHCRKGG